MTREQFLLLLIVLLPLLIPLLLLFLGGVVGAVMERLHFASLNRREEAFAHIITTNTKRPPEGIRSRTYSLVKGEVVVSADYLKTFIATIKHLFGGRIRSMESLLERARWEAFLRLKEEADRQHATVVFNVRYTTTRLRRTFVEVLAYGTAITERKPGEH